jgi:hypothetical protein
MAAFLAQLGGRRLIGVVFGMAIILWVLVQKTMKPRVILGVAIAAATVLLIMQTMLAYRNVGLRAALGGEEEVEGPGYLHVDDNFLRLAQIVELFPKEYPHVYLKYPFYVFARPIPRVLWEGKPTDPGFKLADALEWSGVSLSCSVVGELYMAAGLFGVLLGGWFYGRLGGMAYAVLMSRRAVGALIVYSTFMMALFAGVRSMLDLVLICYVILAWMAICALYRMTYTHRHG